MLIMLPQAHKKMHICTSLKGGPEGGCDIKLVKPILINCGNIFNI